MTKKISELTEDTSPASTSEMELNVSGNSRKAKLSNLHKNMSVPAKITSQTAAPTVNDDTGDGYKVGDLWIDETNDKVYILLDATAGAAVWREITSKRRYMAWRVVAKGTNVATGTNLWGDFEAPFGGTILEVGAFNDTAGTTGTMTIDINKGGTTIMTTNKVTIDTTEKTSRTAATAAALTTTSLAAGDLITFDVDAIHTTPAQGLVVWMSVLESNP